MHGFLQDLRFGLRQLRSRPGFAAAAILTLALGIGANTAVFSLLNGYLLKPLPYPNGGQLARVVFGVPKLRAEPFPVISLPIYRVIRQKTNAFVATAFYTHGTSSIVADGRARHVASIYSSASLFDVLGVHPILGQAFTSDNNQPGNGKVVLISYSLWRNSFGADPDVIGTNVKLDDGMHRIIGVLPKDFVFPNRTEALWIPYHLDPKAFSPKRALALGASFIGRLRPGVTANNAAAQVQHAVKLYMLAKASPDIHKINRRAGMVMGVQPYHQVLLRGRSATLWLLQGAVLLILLMTCVNVANLLLSRMLGRSHEIAMRSALGATRSLLARQLLGEALCLTVPGGLAGVLLAWLGLEYLAGSPFGTGDTIFSTAFDWRVGLFVLGAVLFTAAVVSVLPIRQLAKTDLQGILQEGSRTSGGGRGAKRTRKVLVIAELTLATGLLAMAGLLLHSFMNLENVNPGFRENHVLMARLLVPAKDHPGPKALKNFYVDMQQRIEALPGVRQAAMASILPLMGGRQNTSLPLGAFSIPGQKLDTGKQPAAMFNFITPTYFKTLGIPILRGRPFDARDTDKHTLIIDAGLAEKYFHDSSPVGRQLLLGNGEKYTIVGVVPSIKYATLSTASASTTIYMNAAYLTDKRGPSRITTLLIYTALPPNALVDPVRNLIASMDPDVAVYDVRTMHEQVSDALSHKQTTMTLLLAFGGIALALAIVGVYAVMSYAVGQRRAECGVRLALGALPEDLSWMILKDGFRLLAVGLILGLGLAVLAGYVISAQLYGVAPFDPLTLIGSAVILCIITLIACWLPARSAAKVDPAIAMMEQ